MEKVLELDVGGKPMRFETGKVAKQAGGACTVAYGDSLVLVTMCNTDEPRPVDFLPLMVEYREKTYAAGKIPGGFFKREGRPYEKETLTSRLIDRPIRPLIEEYNRLDLQIIANVLSADQENDTDVLAMNGASLALSLSPMPWYGPTAAVRVGLVDGQYVINPTIPQAEAGRLDLIVVGTRDKIVMLAGDAAEVSEEELAGAVEAAFPVIREIAAAIARFTAGVEKLTLTPPSRDFPREAEVRDFFRARVVAAAAGATKKERRVAWRAMLEEAVAQFARLNEYEHAAADKSLIKKILSDVEEAEARRLVLEEGRRQDGRGFDELRPITGAVGVLPRAHGSALFTRGETQALVATTLGTVSDEQKVEDLQGERTKAFMLHYNFPPFSVGEVQPIRGTGRREIGHGALAESAFRHVLPAEDDFPYTIRVVSDILESNGSSSMASVCGASLSLMDAGVPVKKAVAGISVGLVSEGDRHVFLTDIQGLEDYAGDMDFKVAGTRDGVTALQLDMKVRGLDPGVIRDGLARAREARHKILDQMDAVLARPRPELSPYAPRIYIMMIDIEKIGTVIGPGGKVIRRIIADTGVEIDIEDDGKVTIASPDEAAANRAMEIVKALTTTPEVGAVFTGKVTRLMKFGVFVELVPGVEGMVHISQLDTKRTERVEDVVKVGDEVTVKVVEIDDLGRINLSRKVLMPGGEGSDTSRPGSRGDRPGRDGRRRDERRGDDSRRRPKDRG